MQLDTYQFAAIYFVLFVVIFSILWFLFRKLWTAAAKKIEEDRRYFQENEDQFYFFVGIVLILLFIFSMRNLLPFQSW